jgi:ribosomal peptide maturation radical SAM protein 1
MLNRQAGRPEPSVMLVSMPWTTLEEPSLGLAILRAVLDRQGIACRILHMNLFMLEHLRGRSYHALAHTYILNDFLFSWTLDPVVTNAQQRALRQKVRELVNPRGGFDPMEFGGSEGVAEAVLRLRNEIIPPWLERWADEIAADPATLVGFTCMFDQTIASLALAKLVKERAPHKLIALGGYAVRAPTAEMIVRSSPWVDAVCNGEGEATIVELARAAAGQIALHEVPGVTYRSADGEVRLTDPAPEVKMDDVPTPNFDDFFVDIRRLSEQHKVDVTVMDLPIENSRGCWWGAKSHCVFCGIRDKDLVYRYRSAARALEVMNELYQRYGIGQFRFSDYILPHKYFDTLLPDLVRAGAPYTLCCEMKSNITEARFAMMARAGFMEVQPGIESFSSEVLRKMAKGVSAVQNVHTLLLGRRFGVRVFYNIIYGFPDDELAEYEEMMRLLPRLVHLDAPVTCVPAQITRWAPLQTTPERFDIPLAAPEQNYELLFSRGYLDRSGFEIDKFCYYFTRTFENSTRLNRLYDGIFDFVADWRNRFAARDAWLYFDGPGDARGVKVRDRRSSEEKLLELDWAAAAVLKAARQPVSLELLCEAGIVGLSSSSIETLVEELDDLELIFREGSRFVSLVLSGPAIEKPNIEIPPKEKEGIFSLRSGHVDEHPARTSLDKNSSAAMR